jgi:hypothetical protein
VAIDSFVRTIRGSFVQQIEPSEDALSMEGIGDFITAFLAGLSWVTSPGPK